MVMAESTPLGSTTICTEMVEQTEAEELLTLGAAVSWLTAQTRGVTL